MGDLCAFHSTRLHRTGSLDHANLWHFDRKPYIAAAAKVLCEDSGGSRLAPSLSAMQQLLDSCRDFLCPQGDVLRRGWTTAQKAKSILAKIHQQRGEHAGLLILSAFIGTATMPKPTASPLYFKIQCARAVYRLCRSEKSDLFGRTQSHRIGLQGYRLAVALYELVDAVAWPLRPRH